MSVTTSLDNYTLVSNNNFSGDTSIEYKSKSIWKADNKRKGQLRVNLVEEQYKSFGYKVTKYKLEDNFHVDLIAENEKEVLGIEISNWAKYLHVRTDVYKGMVRHWRNLERELFEKADHRRYRKIYVYSYGENIENILRYLEANDVELVEIGYQDMPKQERGWIE